MSLGLNKQNSADILALQRELNAIVNQLHAVTLLHGTTAHRWQPAVNVYRCETGYHVCIELAGVAATTLHMRAETRRLAIFGRRQRPEPAGEEMLQVLAMEIDHGRFERIISFPLDIDVARIEVEHADGLTWVRLPLVCEA